MSFDTIIPLQRLQQMQQAQAVAGRKLILKQTVSTADLWVTGIGVTLAIPTLSLSCWALIVYFAIKEMVRKTYLVRNVATGGKFRVYKDDFKQYKKQFKHKEKEIRTILDLEKKAEMLSEIVKDTTEK
ncbi:hypothetical protein G4D61_11020 [Bacillus ginsengihumi]|uniref:Uncharacterized protein n=1 Tax=Heyndrickxia ginsengihumi TaxID=363870 RepID=A0A6M0P7I8_9BACI|nr:hypothetical protein [Heyndrickxia ginsengihumi]NEY20487.1 hypothetical protein [Heyndrickxia ginsengihumi]